MSEFVSSRLRCPVCGGEFVADELHGASIARRETDLRPVFDGQDPLATHVHTCPGCRYSAYRAGFETEPSDEDELIEELDEDPASLPRPLIELPDDEDVLDLRRYTRSGELSEELVGPDGEPFGPVRYWIAARVHEFLNEEDLVGAAHFYLRAAWCARAVNDRPMERRSQREVLLRLSTVLERGGLSTLERLRHLYLAGEVARRASDFGRAVDWFAQLEREADPDEDEPARLAGLARRQSLLALVKSDVNATLPEDLPGARRVSFDDDAEGDDLSDDDSDDGVN